MANYYNELPEGYVLDYKIDAKNKSIGVIFNLIALVAMVLIFLLGLAIKDFAFTFTKKDWYLYPIFLVSMVAYMVLHELVHGLFYKIFTHEKLTFGLTFSVAYCGVPNLYVKKGPMMVTIIAPFVVFNAIMIPLLFVSDNLMYFYMIMLLIGIHNGGCSGDIYGFFVMLFKYRGKDILVNDDGPCQKFFVKK